MIAFSYLKIEIIQHPPHPQQLLYLFDNAVRFFQTKFPKFNYDNCKKLPIVTRS